MSVCYYRLLGSRAKAAVIYDDGTATIDGTDSTADAVALMRREAIDQAEYDRLMARPPHVPARMGGANVYVDIAKRWADVAIADRVAAEKCDDLRRVLLAAIRDAKDMREAELRPLREATEVARTRWDSILAPITAAAEMLRGKLTEWLRGQQGSPVSASGNGTAITTSDGLTTYSQPSAPALIRGNYPGKATGLRTMWRAEVVDAAMAFNHFRDHAGVIDVLTKLACAEARARRGAGEIPGCRMFKEEMDKDG